MMKALCVAALILLAATALATNNRDVCDNTGRYCFADAVFDCVNSTPKAVQGCELCRNGACVDAPLAPDVKVKELPAASKTAPSNELLPYILLASVIAAILFLYLRIRARR
jgi:hypothetical protein